MAKFKIEGMEELQKTIKKLGELPQRCVTTAARKGSNIALKSAKQNAPVDTGSLKRGISQKGERAKTKGKKVYQVTFNKAMNDVFVTESKSGKRGYYPAAQEYGFFAKNGRYIPGFHYMKKSVEENTTQIEREIVNVLSKEIDKLK